MVFESMVEDTGLDLVIAENGLEAVNVIKREAPFDLVFMDIQMPVMDGVDACRKIKALHPDLPIIALTANVMESDIRRYKKSGFDEHMGKPVELNLLFQLLNSKLTGLKKPDDLGSRRVG